MSEMKYYRGFLFLFGIALAVSISAAEAMAALLCLDWLARELFRKNSLPRRVSPFIWPVTIYYVWGIGSVLFNGRPLTSDVFSSQLAVFLVLFAVRRLTIDDIRFLGGGFVVASAAVGLLGVVQMASRINYLPNELAFQTPAFMESWPRGLLDIFSMRNMRAVGTRSHPLTYAEGLIPAFFVLLLWIFKGRGSSIRDRAWPIGAWVLVAAGIVFSQSRGVWVGLLAGLGIFSVYLPRRVAIRATVMAAVILPVMFFASPVLRGRVASIFTAQGGSIGDQQSKSVRMALWAEALHQFPASPWVGQGLEEVKLPVPTAGDEHRIWSETHNMYLQTLLETGVIGLGLLLWIFVLFGWALLRGPFPMRPAMAAAFASFLVAGITESWINDKEVGLIFWMLLGAAEAWRLGTGPEMAREKE